MRNTGYSRRRSYSRPSNRSTERSDNWARNYRDEQKLEPRKRLLRSRNKIVGGVCSGLANYFGIDRTIIRVAAFVIFLIWTLPTLIAYFVLCLCLDVEPKRGMRAHLSGEEGDGDVWTRMRDNPAGAAREVGRKVRKLERRVRNRKPDDGAREDLKKVFRDL